MPYTFIIKGENVNYVNYNRELKAAMLEDIFNNPLDFVCMSEDEWNKEYKPLPLVEKLDKIHKLYIEKKSAKN